MLGELHVVDEVSGLMKKLVDEKFASDQGVPEKAEQYVLSQPRHQEHFEEFSQVHHVELLRTITTIELDGF